MGLNIAARRKLSLKGFAMGWDNCYLVVKSANEEQRKEWQAALDGVSDKDREEEATSVLREACLDVIVSGVVMDTNEDGESKEVTFDSSDVPTVVEALNFAWQLEVVGVSTGTDRLKAILSSV